MQYCPWCKKIKKTHNDKWETIPAEIPQDAKNIICDDCLKAELDNLEKEKVKV